MHTKVVFQGAKALDAHRLRRAAVQLPRRRPQRRHVGRGTRRAGRLPRRARLLAPARYPGLELWAAGFSFGSYIAMTVGAEDDRVCALIGIAPPVDRYDFAVGASVDQAEVHHSRRGGRADSAEDRCASSTHSSAEPKELVEIDRANHLFEGQASEVGDALEELLADFTCRTQ